MAEKTNREKLQFIVAHAKADANLCAVAYEIIKESEKADRGAILREFIDKYRRTPSDGTVDLPRVIDNLEERRLMGEYGSYVDQKVDELIRENLDETAFYEKLADFIMTDEKLQEESAGAIAIFDCAIDSKFPYHWIDVSKALTMDQEKYIQIQQQVGDDKLDQIESALTYEFEQKTERASVVLSLIEERESYEERVIMMCRVLTHFEKEFMGMHMRDLKGSLLRSLLEV